MKGLIQQIEERGNTYEPMSRENMIAALEEMQKREREAFIKRERKRKVDERHLIERSKELGKPIPQILAYYVHTQQTWWATKEQAYEYAEWFYPTQKEIEETYIKYKIKENE